MGRNSKTFEKYLINDPTLFDYYVNRNDYAISPATAFLKYTIEAKDAINMCVKHFPKKNTKEYTKAATDSLRYVSAALLPAIMGHFETFEKYLFAGMYENSVFLQKFDVRSFHTKISKISEHEVAIDLGGISPYRNYDGISVGMMLADNLHRWSSPDTVNKYYKCFADYNFFGEEEKKQLFVLWQLRHSLVHNGGTITRADSQKVERLNDCSNATIIFENNFINEVARKMHEIVGVATQGLGEAYIKRLIPSITMTQRKKIEKLFQVRSSVGVWLKGDINETSI